MTKKVTMVFVLTLCVWSLTISAQESISDFTNTVHRRYYLLARLKQPLVQLEAMIKKKNCTGVINSLPIYFFTHPLLQNSLERCRARGSFKPFFAVSRQLKRYDALDDDELIDQWVRLVALVMLRCRQEFKTADQDMSLYIQQAGLEELLDLLDVLSRKECTDFSTIKKRDPECFYCDVGTKEVALRYYLIKRLQGAFSFLADFKTFPVLVEADNLVGNHLYMVCPELIGFQHQMIIDCLRDVVARKTSEPLWDLWQKIQQFQLIDDTIFLKEFNQLVIVVYKNLVLNNSPDADQLVDQMCHTYYEIKEMPVYELLEEIDSLSRNSLSLQQDVCSSFVYWFDKATYPLVALAVYYSLAYI